VVAGENQKKIEKSDEAGEALAATIEARLRTGRPLAAREWIAAQERQLARQLAPRKPGPKPKRERPEATTQDQGAIKPVLLEPNRL